VDSARRVIAEAQQIRAIGTRHSFNGIADSAGELIDLSGIDPNVIIDPEGRSVTVGSGTTYGYLADHLQRSGWALPNMASLPHISLVGAIMTGTHGSGDRLGVLATSVNALEIVTYAGDIVRINRGHPEFEGMVVGLGAFGVVTRLSLDILPSFNMRQDVFEGLSWDAVLSELDSIMAAGYSVCLLTMWSATTIMLFWIKSRLADGPPVVAAWNVSPAGQSELTADPAVMATLNPCNGEPGPWSERLPHFRHDTPIPVPDQLQSEYFLPRYRAIEALRALRAIGDRIDPHLVTTEIRSMAGDTLWLSPAFGHDSISIAFSWKMNVGAVSALTAEIEALLLPLGGRPHWGKIMHASSKELESLYPRLPAFRELVRSFDPMGKFHNRFLETHGGVFRPIHKKSLDKK
jgi:xylitol oxidase